MNDLPKDKRPPDSILWGDNPDRLDEWLDKVYKPKESVDNLRDDTVYIDLDDIG